MRYESARYSSYYHFQNTLPLHLHYAPYKSFVGRNSSGSQLFEDAYRLLFYRFIELKFCFCLKKHETRFFAYYYTFYYIWVIFNNIQRVSRHFFPRSLLFNVRILDSMLTQAFCMLNFLCKIFHMNSLWIPTVSANAEIPNPFDNVIRFWRGRVTSVEIIFNAFSTPLKMLKNAQDNARDEYLLQYISLNK